ncbi:MAG: recombinase family protein [Pseudonocardiaceae bacterium]
MTIIARYRGATAPANDRTCSTEECIRRGWEIVGEYRDEGISGKAIRNRPGLAAALQALDASEAAVLMVAKIDRLSRSVVDASTLLERVQRSRWSLVTCDLAIDTTTPAGEAALGMMIVFSQLERRLIGQRTAEALAVKRAQGVQLGRPDRSSAAVVARITAERAEGRSLRAIADGLTTDAVPTGQGGQRWHASSVRAVLARSGL